MDKSKSPPADAPALRRRAETKRSERPPRSPAVGPRARQQTERLVHELEVHQIELELQNEELQQTRSDLEVGLQSYTELYDFAPTGYLTLDLDGTIEKVNLTAARLLGRERSQLVGTRLGVFVSVECRAFLHAFLARVFGAQAKQVCEVALGATQSTQLWVSIEAAASASRQECWATLTDVTERRRVELAMQDSERRCREIADALRDAGRNKDEFLALLSHELRTPLSAIRNSVYILEQVTPGGDDAKRAQAIICRQTSHMTRLIDDLLDVTRVSQGKIRMKLEPLDLRELVRRTAEDYLPAFETNGIALEVSVGDEAVLVQGDRTRLVQVLGNLLGNAAKFSARGGRAAIALRRDTETAEAVIRVQDTGAGIEATMLPHVFEPYVQADSTMLRSRGGLGIGLALVKGLVELHGGSASAHSAGPGLGAELRIRLPLADVQRKA